MIESLNSFAAAVAACLVNTAAVCCAGVALAALAARFRGWSAASRYALWWLMLAFVIAAPFVSAFLPTEQPDPTIPPAPVRRVAALRVVSYSRDATPVNVPTAQLTTAALLLLLGCAASGFQMIVLIRGFLYGVRLKRKSKEASDNLQGLFMPLDRKRRVSLRVSDELSIPALVGYFKPMVLIPADLNSRLSDAELEQVLLHELAHVARYDDWSIALQRLIETMAIWHPLLRYLGYRLSRDREMICDDLVASMHEPKGYAACLAKVADLGPFAPLSAMAVPLLERKSELLARVEMLLDRTRAHVPRMSGSRMGIALVGFMLLGLVGARVPRLMAMPAAKQVPPVPPVQPVAPAPPPAPALPPVAPPPPIPPVPANGSRFMYSYSDQDQRTSGNYSIVVTTENGQSSMFGRWSKFSSGDGGREPGTIEFKTNNKTFVIRDKEFLARAKKILQPMEELGRKQSALGEQQEKLGELQSDLGEKQEKVANRPLDASQAENLEKSSQKLKAEIDLLNSKSTQKSLVAAQEQLAKLQEELAEIQEEMGSEQGKLGQVQGRLGEEQGKLGAQQGQLGKLQGELGRQQGEETRRAEKKLNELIREAQNRGLAVEVR